MLAVWTERANRMSAISHQAYGPLAGVPRLLRILAKHGITSTFFVPGYTAVRYPDVIRSIVDMAMRSRTTGICMSRWQG
ncbi:MAG: putative xylanase/chitin deacetylase [Mycobacterium sp.]|nr:putative xylanase/chitin deacetylase [Mycobacterium sp.]